MLLKNLANLVKRHLGVLVYHLDPLTTARSAQFQQTEQGSLHFAFAVAVLLFSYLYGVLYFVLYLDHFDDDHLGRWHQQHHSTAAERAAAATAAASATDKDHQNVSTALPAAVSLCPLSMYHQAFPPPIWAQVDVLLGTAAATAAVVLATLLYSGVKAPDSTASRRYNCVPLGNNNNKLSHKVPAQPSQTRSHKLKILVGGRGKWKGVFFIS